MDPDLTENTVPAEGSVSATQPDTGIADSGAGDQGQDSMTSYVVAAPQDTGTIYINDQGQEVITYYAVAAPQDTGTIYINDQGQEVASILAINGSQFSQEIVGTSSPDEIIGSEERDLLSGGYGKDRLTGEGGADAFVFEVPSQFGKKNADIITDFDPDSGDKLVISSDVFGKISKVRLAVATGKKEVAQASRANKNIVYDDKNGVLYYDDNGKKSGWGDGGVFTQLLGSPEISKTDFVLA